MSENIADLLAALISEDEAQPKVAAQPEVVAQQEIAAARLAALPEALQPEALSALQGLLAATEADRRWWAARAIAALPGKNIPPVLLQVLQDEDASVRQCAALGLRQRPDARAVAGLVRALDDPDALVRRLAGEALEAIGGEAVPALLEVMGGGSQTARLEAVRALATIGDARSIPALFAALEGSALLEYWANEGLERMGVGMRFIIPE
jgi:HEAT repeat protein